MTRVRALAPLFAAALLSACCTKPNDLVVVLPSSDGHVGGLTVQTAGETMVLDKAYAGARPGTEVKGTVEVAPEEVEQAFGNALAARPIPPKSYTLYFLSGGDELVPESQAALDAMLAEVSARKAVEVVITGHTDTQGSTEDNDRLSLERATAVEAKLKDALAAHGVASESITAVGRGERDLLVQTPDRRAEPRNRRVEITVR